MYLRYLIILTDSVYMYIYILYVYLERERERERQRERERERESGTIILVILEAPTEQEASGLHVWLGQERPYFDGRHRSCLKAWALRMDP